MELHSFFAPSKNFTNQQALDHRYLITFEHPSLPNRAGKSFKLIEAEARRHQKRLENQPPQDPTKRVRIPVPRGKQHITVRGLARPEINIKLLAEALLDYVETKARKEAA